MDTKIREALDKAGYTGGHDLKSLMESVLNKNREFDLNVWSSRYTKKGEEGWTASTTHPEFEVIASEPEDAIALLWLILNCLIKEDVEAYIRYQVIKQDIHPQRNRPSWKFEPIDVDKIDRMALKAKLKDAHAKYPLI
jgi:hypothetical protein